MNYFTAFLTLSIVLYFELTLSQNVKYSIFRFSKFEYSIIKSEVLPLTFLFFNSILLSRSLSSYHFSSCSYFSPYPTPPLFSSTSNRQCPYHTFSPPLAALIKKFIHSCVVETFTQYSEKVISSFHQTSNSVDIKLFLPKVRIRVFISVMFFTD